MSRIYSVTFENVSISTAVDLFSIQPADDKPVKFRAMYLSNVGGTADAGDTNEELLRILVRRGHTSVGSGGTAVTATKQVGQSTDTDWSFTARTNDTTVATAGTTQDLHADGWNIRVPYQMVWPIDLCPGAGQGNTTIVARLVAAPADAVACSGSLYVEEMG